MAPLNVLFLCTSNTARSVLSEGILRREGGDRFAAFSAGSQPKGVVNPFALATLGAQGCPTGGYSSKSWSVFAAGDAPVMDIIITVCDSAAGEACPIWPGKPASAHWGVPDPAAVEGTDAEKSAAFAAAFSLLEARIRALVALPVETLAKPDLTAALRRIGATVGVAPEAASPPGDTA
jgi:arsenate reductase